MAEQYIVSALKYRPQTFKTVVGQSHITTTLINAILHNQLAHSFLFCGPRGVGKTSCARILAKTINCTQRTPEGEACDTCHSCTSFKENTSLNIYELDAASNNGVDEIRELINQVRYAPQGGKYKVYIIDEVHMLTQQAFNAFLKTLEEPPPYAIFILATTEKHKILPTILSRCQLFEFNRITLHDIVTHLSEICTTENIEFEKDALQLIALKSEGCMRDALSIMDKIASFSNAHITYNATLQHLNILDYDYYFKLINTLCLQDISTVLLIYDEILNKGFEGDTFIYGFCEHLRNLLICKDVVAVKLLETTDSIKSNYYQQAVQVNTSYIINALSILQMCELNYKQARNKRLHVELALIKLNYLPYAIQLIENQDNELVKKKIITNQILPIGELEKKPEVQAKQTQPFFNHSKVETDSPTVINQSETVLNHSTVQTEPKQNLSKKKLIENARNKIAITAQNNTKQAITQDELQTNWEEQKQLLIIDKKLHATVLDSVIIHYHENEITFKGTIVVIDILREERIRLLDYFKQKFNDDTINIFFQVEEVKAHQVTEKTMSSKELYEHFSTQNPLIKKLKENMGFDIEY